MSKFGILNKLNWSIVIPVALIGMALLLSNWLLEEKPTMQRGERKAPPVTVEVAEAEYGQFPLTIKALGKVAARELVELQPQVEGRVEWLDYDLGPGSTLEKGQPLMRIEREPYQLALQSARSSLAERRAELQQEEGQRTVAEEEFELLGSSLPDADRALVLREPQLAAARARVDAAHASVNLAQRDLRLTAIASPFTALLVSRSVDIGDRVAPGTVMYNLAGADRFQIEVEVPARQLPQLNTPKATVRIRGSQWPAGEYRDGRFVRVIPVLEEQGRLARVLVELDDPLGIENPSRPQLLLNDLARVEITGRANGQQVRIPLTALQDGDRVWIVRDGKIVIQPVRVAHFNEEFAVLESGLRGGEILVTTRLASVTDGMPVRVAETARQKTQSQKSEPPELPERPRSDGADGERG
ncbi:efflux RND transporter periplasmic adaptor subunit [Microbulbifer bruguierae]|uniref:Efflux RND transporter periplasmic adaptor subunit n=1 Tax=Microbulbifer bruguierae TaxID=3029061 RepID=A0ABY8NDZ3_9GAMM|nr:efflux RND transporter periplasmic adaptor subunit [Microbulbifer bruguierae]WGL16930.1 efflux RND transporter periplasmic adaptor subunit [Microbulbifer bruguierae]